jgi:preprotein translocase subunit SecE
MQIRVSSSNWQSTGLQIRGLQVRALPGPLADKKRQTYMALQEQLSKVRDIVPRTVTFLQEVWAELKKVHWPSRKETYAATAVVLVVVSIVSIFLGTVDLALSSLIQAILR